jgi:hypothetical protein
VPLASRLPALLARTILADSDRVFYGDAATFVRAFRQFYDTAKIVYVSRNVSRENAAVLERWSRAWLVSPPPSSPTGSHCVHPCT